MSNRVEIPTSLRPTALSLRQLLWLEPLDSDGRRDKAIARQAARQVARLPRFLLAVHAASTLSVIALVGWWNATATLPMLLAGFATLLLLDGIAIALVAHNRRNGRNAQKLVGGMAILLSLEMVTIGAVAGLLAAADPQGSGWGEAFAALNLGAIAIGVLGSPLLTLCALAASALGLSFFLRDPTSWVALAAAVPVLMHFSLAWARTQIAAAREREAIGREAAKALDFVVEFELSGRGWFWETDAQGTLSYVSEQLADDFDCARDDLLGRRFTDLLLVERSPELTRAQADERSLAFYLSARFPFNDVAVTAANGDVAWSLSGNPVFERDGSFRGFRGIGTDLTAQRQQQQEINRLAKFCSLTGLPNRSMMRATLEEAVRNLEQRGRGAALFMIDLDRFKQVNDTFGHPVGDKLLREVARRLADAVGDKGQVGRLGGDEFLVVLSGVVERDDLEARAIAMIERVSQPYLLGGNRINIGASIGVAIADPARACAETLSRDADLALYAAKAAGRGKCRFFAAEMQANASRRQLLETDLRLAIERDEIWTVFQPIVDAETEQLCGFEALVRWHHPHRGEIGPDVFIPLAEDSGMIGAIGRHVLDRAVAQAVEWPRHIRLAVNLSPAQFDDPHLVDTIHSTLTRYGLEPNRLELELTENLFLAQGPETEAKLMALKAIGVRLALDDFGTGYSSMGYLQSAPFDKIKIDQAFVRGAANNNKRNAAIIRAIVTLAQSLDMDTTAEGVESAEDLALVRELGVSQVQGFHFGRPQTASQAVDLAKSVASATNRKGEQLRVRRHRLTRRAIASFDGVPSEIFLKNISVLGAMAETPREVAIGQSLTLDIIGVGPVSGTIRWAVPGRFGIEFDQPFEVERLSAATPPLPTPLPAAAPRRDGTSG